MARLQQIHGVASLLPLYLVGDALAFYIEDAFTEYTKLTMARCMGECVDVYTNRIRQLVGLPGFKRAELEKLAKLTFVKGFPDTISIGIRPTPSIETLTMVT